MTRQQAVVGALVRWPVVHAEWYGVIEAVGFHHVKVRTETGRMTLLFWRTGASRLQLVERPAVRREAHS